MIRFQRGASAAAFVVIATAFGSVHAEDLSGYSGAQLYQRFCASCHGADGLGDGPVASSLKVMVPDLAHLAKRHGGTFPSEQVRRIIDGLETRPPHGPRDMPVWGLEFRAAAADDPQASVRADELITKLVKFLRSIQRE
jgi:mono/diheme cytochrome c family protein